MAPNYRLILSLNDVGVLFTTPLPKLLILLYLPFEVAVGWLLTIPLGEGIIVLLLTKESLFEKRNFLAGVEELFVVL